MMVEELLIWLFWYSQRHNYPGNAFANVLTVLRTPDQVIHFQGHQGQGQMNQQ